MKKEVVILIAEDDEGHATLIKKNLKRAGLLNEIKHFKDGQEILDFLFGNGENNTKQKDTGYLLLLDIRMPKIDGEEVLKKIKEHEELHKMPVIMITTTDDPREVEKCHLLGCNNYLTKPVDYAKFVDVIRQLGLFLLVVEVPKMDGEN
jgi:CheY-like chemotaxis protein